MGGCPPIAMKISVRHSDDRREEESSRQALRWISFNCAQDMLQSLRSFGMT